MEELTEVITAAEFHPIECSTFAYSSSKGTVRLCDMRQSALCDSHSKSKSIICAFCFVSFTSSLQSFVLCHQAICNIATSIQGLKLRLPGRQCD